MARMMPSAASTRLSCHTLGWRVHQQQTQQHAVATVSKPMLPRGAPMTMLAPRDECIRARWRRRGRGVLMCWNHTPH